MRTQSNLIPFLIDQREELNGWKATYNQGRSALGGGLQQKSRLSEISVILQLCRNALGVVYIAVSNFRSMLN